MAGRTSPSLGITILVPLLLFLTAALGLAQECRECSLPGFRSGRDSLVKVRFRDLRTLDNCISVRRIIANLYGQETQALRLRFWRNGACADTTVAVEQVASLTVGGLGIGGQPLMIRVLPAREFYCNDDEASPPTRFVEVTAIGGYGGSDTSGRKVGFSSIYGGVEGLVAPFRSFPSDRVTLALGAGLLLERDRMRFPLLADLRWSFLGGMHVQSSQEFRPSECQFRTDEPPIDVPAEGCTELDNGGDHDSSVYYLRRKQTMVDRFRPFLYGEGGFILDGGYTGHGRTPSLNAGDYGEYLLGAGIGMPIFDVGTVSVGYRFLRLNLRTPCPTCVSDTDGEPLYWITNTNLVHSLIVKLGWRLQFH